MKQNRRQKIDKYKGTGMKKVYIQVSTHWDREWYNHFQAFRYDLIKTTDKIISEVTSKEHIDNFVFDGQTIVLEDYLEIMSQNYDKLASVIQDGGLKIGPWYVMPDEWLVSGESLIRNFEQGKKICGEFGVEPFQYGYVNDIFGHIAQFPQILKKLGIRMAYLGRGLSPKQDGDFRHFIWEAPDGSECLTYKYNYSGAYRHYLRFLNQQERTEEEKDDYVKNYIMSELEKSKIGVVLLNITDDHAYLNDIMLDFIDRVKRIKDIEVDVSGFDQAYEDIASAKDAFPVYKGELIDTQYPRSGDMKVVTDSISSYYTLKAENDDCQAILEDETSPMIAYSHMANEPIRKEFLQAAYKELLKNHPHDNICGCSTDQVHKDMTYRYVQVRELAQAVKRDFLCRIGRVEEGSDFDYLLEIFNPAPYQRKQIVTVELEFATNYPTKFHGNAPHQPKNTFVIYDNNRNEMEYQILKIERGVLHDKCNISQNKQKIDRYTIAMEAKLDGFGMTEFKVKPLRGLNRDRNPMKSGDNWAENAYAKIEIEQDGTISLTDKTNGKVYHKLHYFLDDADGGNGWFQEDAANQNAVVTSRFADCYLEKIQSGCMQITFRLTQVMQVPECLDYDTFSRSSQKKAFKIVSEITLKRDSGKIYVETTVENNIKDHRLRLQLPTNVEGDHYKVSQAFYMAERKVGLDPDRINFGEQEKHERHFDGIIYKTDADGNGLAFVGKEGFHQAGVLDDVEGTISVVMFRSFGRFILTHDVGAGQILGDLKFRYAIVPMNSQIGDCELLHERKHDFDKEIAVFTKCKEGTEMMAERGLLQTEGKKVAISIVKIAEHRDDTVVVRAFNTSGETSTMNISLAAKAKQISEVDMHENEMEVLATDVNQITVPLQAYEIKTIAIQY